MAKISLIKLQVLYFKVKVDKMWKCLWFLTEREKNTAEKTFTKDQIYCIGQIWWLHNRNMQPILIIFQGVQHTLSLALGAF